jgi:hypothetical protein
VRLESPATGGLTVVVDLGGRAAGQP